MEKAIIFDMDGLLLDTENIAYQVFNEEIKQYNLEIDLNSFSKFVGLGKNEFSDELEKRYKCIENINDFISSFYKNLENKILEVTPKVKFGALELIEYLKVSNIPIALATSTYKIPATKILKKKKLLHYFDVVVTGDMVSESKPSPEIFLKTISELNIQAKNVVILEDSANGIRAAYLSGANPILIPDLKIPPKEVQELTTNIYDNLLEVLEAIKAGNL